MARRARKEGVDMLSYDELKDFIRSHHLQSEILRDLCGIPQEIIANAEGRNKTTHEFPCPKCSDKPTSTRFCIVDLAEGAVRCRHCCPDGDAGSGDIIGAVQWAKGLNGKDGRNEAKRELEKWLIDRGYISEPRRQKQGGKRLTTTKTTKTTREHDADETLTLTAEGVEYEDNNVSRLPIKTTFYHRFNPKTGFISTFRRDDFDDPKPKNKETKWIKLEKDAKGASVYAPYIAGAATTTEEPSKDALERLYDEVYHATRFYITEGEKCAEALKNDVRSTSYDGAVMTMGGSGNAKLWPIWAAHLKRKNPNARVTIFADNDACGRKAANETANAFHAAGYRAIEIIELATQPNGDPAPKAYDVADWLEEAPISPLFELAQPYDYLADEYRKRLINALTIRKEHALRLERAQSEREALSFSRRDDNATFPLDVLPEKYAATLETLCGATRTPLGIGYFYLRWILSGTIGPYKAPIDNAGRKTNCQISGAVVGPSSEGKSFLLDELVDLLEPFERQLERDYERLISKKPLWEKRLKEAIERDDRKALRRLQKRLAIIESVQPLFSTSEFASIPALYQTGTINKEVQRLCKRPRNGMLLHFDDEAKLTGSAGTATLDSIASANLSSLIKLMDCKPSATRVLGDRKRIIHRDVGASICILTQASSLLAWGNGTLQNKGAFQRMRLFKFDWDGVRTNPNQRLDKELATIGELFNKGWRWEGQTTHTMPAYEDRYNDWFCEIDNERKKYRNAGEEYLFAWLGKIQSRIHADAFLLHVLNHVASGWSLDSLSGIPASAFDAAARIVEYDFKSTARTANYLNVETGKRKVVETTVNVPLATKIRNVYEIGRNGEPCDITQGDELGRARTITELGRPDKGGTTFYNAKNRETVDDQLSKLGLLVIDPRTKGRNDQGRRVFIPDDLTSEQYDRLIRILDFEDVEESDVSEDADAEEEVPF